MFSIRRFWVVVSVLFSCFVAQVHGQPSLSILIWGDVSAGQGSPPPPNSGFVGIAAGETHNLGLRTNGSIAAWGSNVYGQTSVPSPNTDFVAIDAGQSHSLGLKTNGSIVAWGRNFEGQCNVPSPNSDFVAISAGWYHSLGLKDDGSVVAWGGNGSGQSTVPAVNRDFVAVSAGYNHSLGLKEDSTIAAWGRNVERQCNVPAPNIDFVAVSAGKYHSLGLKADGSIVAWGGNTEGQLQVPAPNSGFTAIAAGAYHNLGLRANGSIATWGNNLFGQGNIPVLNLYFVSIAAGGDHSLGIRDVRPCSSVSDCNDGLTCTMDSCDPTTHLCIHKPHDEMCVDSFFCNGTEYCDPARGCQIEPRYCDDDVFCTIDTCDENTDSCVHTPDDEACASPYCLESYSCDPATGCSCLFGRTLFVAASAPDGGDGLSWATAFRDLQDALAIASIGAMREIHVAKGVYRPSTFDPAATFQLINSVEIKGGYAGPSAYNPNFRNPRLFESILSGALAGNRSNNIVTGSGTDYSAVLDGFTIMGGARGIHCGSGSPTIRNCRIKNNYGYDGSCYHCPGDWAAGVFCRAPALFENCIIENNEAGRAGVDIGGSCGGADVGNGAILDGCTVRNNRAGGSYGTCEVGTCQTGRGGNGGGICADSSVVIRNSLIVGNRAGAAGGYTCGPEDCGVFYGLGNGIYGNPTITNCTIVGNSVGTSEGRAVYGAARISNSILWGNGVTINPQVWGGPIIDHSNIQGWNLGPQDGNFAVDPLFVSGPLGDYYLSQESAGQSSTSPCVDAGSDLASTFGVDLLTTRTDTVGDSGVIDLGYHYPPDCGMDFSQCDGIIDLRTFSDFQNCFMVDDKESYSNGCSEFDLDANTLVDMDDYSDFLTLFLNEP